MATTRDLSRSNKPRQGTKAHRLSKRAASRKSGKGKASKAKSKKTKAISIRPRKSFPLMKLPGELRENVYKHILALDGSTFLRSCRQVYLEARGFAGEYGYFRQKTRCYTLEDGSSAHYVSYQTKTHLNAPDFPRLPPDIFRLIQNVHMSIDLDNLNSENEAPHNPLLPHRCRHYMNDYVPFTWVVGPDQGGWKTCVIEVNCSTTHWGIQRGICLKWLFWGLRILVVFENIFLHITDGSMSNTRFHMARNVKQRTLDRRAEVQNRNMVSYALAVEWLGRYFGRPIWHDSQKTKRRYLEFHPARFQESLRSNTSGKARWV